MALPEIDTLTYERSLRRAGYRRVAGVDEVGRGALAGPLVAAAVILPPYILSRRQRSSFWSQVRDSKTVPGAARSELAGAIRDHAVAVGIGTVSVAAIGEIGLGPANRLAMELAVADLPLDPDWLVIDAMTLDVGTGQFGIIDGDALCLSIAAASIVAKVHRDDLMTALCRTESRYGFARHKGYGVASHLRALAEHGPCEHHRLGFAPVQRAAERVLAS